MIEIVYRCDPRAPSAESAPKSCAEVRERLVEGNRIFANLFDADPAQESQTRVIPIDATALGLTPQTKTAPAQRPFAAVLACADARVPTELIFHQACNHLFVTRVAGNVLSAEGLGSLEYAACHLSASLKLVVVLGHRGCGAVSAAVDCYLRPAEYTSIAPTHGLRAIVDRISHAVRAAAESLQARWGDDVKGHRSYPEALLEAAVVLNAARTASVLRDELRANDGVNVEVAYGVYDLVSRRVEVPMHEKTADGTEAGGLGTPPASPEEFERFAASVAGSKHVQEFLA